MLRKGKMTLRQLSFRLLAVLFSLLLTFLALEASARIARLLKQEYVRRNADFAEENWAVYDPILGYRLNPKWGDFNTQGLRDREISPKGDRFRIVVLGDSVGFYGENVDDTYVGQIRAIMTDGKDDSRVDVVNASFKGYTTYQELLWLKHYGLDLQPDLLVLAFVLNDLHRFLHSFNVRDGKIVQDDMYSFSDEAIGSYIEGPRSVFLEWVAHKTGVARAYLQWRISNGYAFDHRADFSPAWKDQPWQLIDECLDEFVALADEHGFKMCVVVFPFAQQYNEQYLRRDRSYVLKPQRMLAALCDKYELPLLDLYLDLRRDQFDQDQIHLTDGGRQVAAGRVVEFLETHNLIPSRDDKAVTPSKATR